jgi:hypothetical protein
VTVTNPNRARLVGSGAAAAVVRFVKAPHALFTWNPGLLLKTPLVTEMSASETGKGGKDPPNAVE